MELEKLKEIISQVLSVDANEITEETRITEDLGADSLDLYQIVLSIEQEFNISVEDERIEKVTTVGDALKLITEAVNGGRA
ncbi:MAG: acyl carrier protein [Lachnospiraceae bacterium]|nr:acyl carrier protein [Lachnospiraceae bacterium]